MRLSPREIEIGRRSSAFRGACNRCAGFLNRRLNGAALPSDRTSAVELDDHVVDTHADQRRQQMFDRLDRHFLARQPRRQLNARQVVHRGRT
jgi:hypothetical protein